VTRHRVLLFARYAELLGADEVEVELPSGAIVADLVTALRQLPGGDALPVAPLVALDRRQASLGQPVGSPRELALLPPLAGG
jgi:molybdopterin converting factor small subunit